MLEVIKCKCIEIILDEIGQKLTLAPTDENVGKSGILMYAPIKISMGRESKLYKQVDIGNLITLTLDLEVQDKENNNTWLEEIPSWKKNNIIDSNLK